MSNLTEKQLDQIAKVFGIERVLTEENSLPVRDGRVKTTDMVWWRCDTGPEHVLAKEDWNNIQQFPEAYSIDRPRIKGQVTYED